MTETNLDREARSFHIELEYPRLDSNVQEVTVGLTDVRAADTIRITYDFERDGWRLGMDRTVEDGPIMRVTEENAEVAFIPAWNEKPTSVEVIQDRNPESLPDGAEVKYWVQVNGAEAEECDTLEEAMDIRINSTVPLPMRFRTIQKHVSYWTLCEELEPTGESHD